eukprot:509439-Pleurochrysis_carterae.AAC.1
MEGALSGQGRSSRAGFQELKERSASAPQLCVRCECKSAYCEKARATTVYEYLSGTRKGRNGNYFASRSERLNNRTRSRYR